MFTYLKHLFLPQHSNNQRARFIHNQIIFAVALCLLVGGVLVGTTKQHVSSVLGISMNISSDDLLLLTNEQRAKVGLPPLQLDSQLAIAAQNKAQDMFAKDYWAHFGPNGESPWDFIHGAGYQYVYAGENLARGFTTSNSVINAWMASPDHRANMLSPHYNDVGFAVAEGRLPGDSDTVLVVEEFGSRYLAQAPQNRPPVETTVETNQQPSSPAAQEVKPTITITPVPTLGPVLAAVKKQSLFDSAFITKSLSLGLLSLFLLIFGIDVVITENKRTVRLAGHSFDHLIFLIAILVIAISLGLGVVG